MKKFKKISAKQLWFKLDYYTKFFVFLIVFTTGVVILALDWLIYSTGIARSDLIDWLVVFVSTIIVGGVISSFIGKSTLQTIIEINEATNKVANGDFSIRIDTKTDAIELEEMIHNFNIMTKQLSNMELMRNDFIENVSHEFKTPTAVIEGYATLLQNPELSPKEREDYIEKIISNTKRISSLTSNVLLLSKVEHQEIAIQKEQFSLDEKLRKIILSLEEKWSEKEIDLDVSLDRVLLNGNKELLFQAFFNIISNAIKFTQDSGEISISLFQKENFAIISITDNGIGMDIEVLSRIFEKFYQGDTSRSGIGNGLGLALAKKIIDLHGGEIEVKSKKGEGTKFVVVLPMI